MPSDRGSTRDYRLDRTGLGMNLCVAELQSSPLHFQRYDRGRFKPGIGGLTSHQSLHIGVPDLQRCSPNAGAGKILKLLAP